LGSATLGIDPNSLAYQILNSTVGTQLVKILDINNTIVKQTITIDNSDVLDQLNDIPTMTGTEITDIAQQESVNVANQLVNYIQTNTLTAQNFYNLIFNTANNIVNNGLQQVIGTDLNNILGSLSSVLPQFSGNMNQTLSQHQPKGQLQTINITLQKHGKILAIIKKKLTIAQALRLQQAMNNNSLDTTNTQAWLSSVDSAIGGSGVESALSDAGNSFSQVGSDLATNLSNGGSAFNFMGLSQVGNLLSGSVPMLNTLNVQQMVSMLSAMPTSTALSMIGKGALMMSNLNSSQINQLLQQLPQATVSQVIGSQQTVTNYMSTGATFSEQASDTAVALSMRVSTTPVGTILKAILPIGVTIVSERIQ
jgi:hypothetical protein